MCYNRTLQDRWNEALLGESPIVPQAGPRQPPAAAPAVFINVKALFTQTSDFKLQASAFQSPVSGPVGTT